MWRDCVFTGDTLLIGGCGRTDFQSGDAGALFDSITKKLFSLPDATVVFPAHDYNGRTSSTIGAERRTNPRLAGRPRGVHSTDGGAPAAEPRMLDVAVPANRRLGLDLQAA